VKFVDEPVFPFRREWYCEKEGCEGKMVSGDWHISDLVWETQYPHTCNVCGLEMMTKDGRYPMIIHKTKEELGEAERIHVSVDADIQAVREHFERVAEHIVEQSFATAKRQIARRGLIRGELVDIE